MGWSIGFDTDWNRDIGYGVIAFCDHPDCNKEIHRGLSYVCADEEPRGGGGCGLYFCSTHKAYCRWENEEDETPELSECCERCRDRKDFFTPKPEHPHWAWWKMNSKSWMEWRAALPFDDRDEWKALADKYTPSSDDLAEAEEDE